MEAMVRKDFNHPSVIMYSIGNEIPEAGTPMGARVGRALAEKIRSLDGTTLRHRGHQRAAGRRFRALRPARGGTSRATEEPDDETGVNTAMTQIADRLNELMQAPVVAKNSAQTASYLDVVGYNYMETRFATDGELYPNRVIVGSETHPAAIDTGWAAVRRHPHVIGDFTWTGWDYLGEAGIGRTVYGKARSGAGPPVVPGRVPVADRLVRRHRHHRPPPPPVVLPRDRLRVAGRPLPGRAAPGHHGEVGGGHAVVLERRRLELELGRPRGRTGDRGGLRRRRRGRAAGERPLGGPPAERRTAPLPVDVRDGVRTGAARGRGLA